MLPVITVIYKAIETWDYKRQLQGSSTESLYSGCRNNTDSTVFDPQPKLQTEQKSVLITASC